MAGGAVAVRDGAILAAGPAAEVAAAHPDLPETDLGAAILMPGLVDAHTHLEWSLTGGLVPPGPFAPWVGGLIALRGRMSAEDHRVAAAYGARRCLAAGTTTLADSGPTGAGARAMAEAGLRGAVHLEIFGAPEGAAAEAAAAGLAERIAALEADAGPRVAVGVSPHAPYTVGPHLWAALAARPDLADRPWATHLAESPAESRLLATGDGPLAELFARMGFTPGRWPGPDGASPVARLADAGALRRGLVAAHAVQLDRRDPRLLAQAGVAVAHCPTSNAYLECGRAPIAALAGAGVRIGLGSDSPGSGGGYDLRAEARACALVHAASPLGAPSPASLVRLATLGGAAALGMDDAIGSLEPGKRADLLVLRPGPAGAGGDPHLAALDPAAAVDAVLVDGEPLVWRGEPVRGDGERLDARAREVRARLC